MQPPGGDGTFFTDQVPDTQKPIIIEGPAVVSKSTSAITIAWKTDERSDSFVEFGIDSLYGSVKGDALDVTDHRLTLTNLSPATIYNFKVNSTDPNNNGPAYSANSAVSTDAEDDVTPPKIISGPVVESITDNQATVIWGTDENSDTFVEFGTTDAYGTNRILTEDVKFHSMVLTNLLPSTEYHFRVSSSDISDNGPTSSADMTFTTTASPDVVPPVITETSASPVFDKLATVTFKTDELGDTFVEYGLTESLGLTAGSAEDVFDHGLILTNLEPSTRYYFRAGSIDKSGNETLSDSLMFFETEAQPDTDAPAVPSGISIFSGDEKLLLAWNPNIGSDLAGYNIFRKTTGSFQLIETLLTDNSYRDQGLANGTQYQYKINAVDLSGNVSLSSGTISEIPLDGNSPSVPVLSYPAEGQSVNNRNIVFSAANSVLPPGRISMRYEFVVAEEADFFNQVAFAIDIPEGDLSTVWQSDLTLEHGRSYYWKSRAFDGYFYSGWSAGRMFTADSNVVTGVELIDFYGEDDKGSVNLYWSTSEEYDVAGFRLLRSLDSQDGYENITNGLIKSGEMNYKFTDTGSETGHTYFYMLVSVSGSGLPREYEPIEVTVTAPRTFKLHSNYPNPFNPETTIKFELPKQEKVRLLIYNVLGQVVNELVNEQKKAGYHVIKWNGTDSFGRATASGIYFYRITAGKYTNTKKMVLIR
jgi:chitodextrinase